MDNDLSCLGNSADGGSAALVGLHSWFDPSGQHRVRVEAVEATGRMIGVKERQQPGGRVGAGPASPLPLIGVMDASALFGTGLGMGQSRPDLDLFNAFDGIAPARGLMAGLVVSAMVWGAIAVSVWQGLH